MRLDGYLRRQDTWLARTLRWISPLSGQAYALSPAKRLLDLLVAYPAVLLVVLAILLLLAVNKLLYRGHPALFRQTRVGHGGKPLRVVKIRSLVWSASGASAPAFGRFMRQYYLDELPQLLQVARGQLSLVGIRVLPQEVYESLRSEWSGERFEAWRAMYDRSPLGLSGVHQIFRHGDKEDARRFHRDMFYGRRASLGLDLYLLWRTLGSRDSDQRFARKRLSHVTRGRSTQWSLETAQP